MSSERIQRIVIVGGGTAGWMAAAMLSRALPRDCAITVIESEAIGTVGVGEATIPMIKLFNQSLGLDEAEFLRTTQGTYKLGIVFDGWGMPGSRYIHGFGRIGHDLGVVPFHHYWLKRHRQGRAAPLAAYSITASAALAGKCMHALPDRPDSPMADLASAFHFDASLYARYLRGHAEGRGVQRVEGRIVRVQQHPESGHVQTLHLDDGRMLEGQFFLDCSGFRGLLIEQALQAGYEDWSHWLPCDRAVAVPCDSPPGGIAPYTGSTARSAGWQWRIPLQHRVGNGHVFCSRHISDDEATAQLLAHLDGVPQAEPRVLRFTSGRRRQAWKANVVALGLASGFMEPLESTSIHLVQSGIARLLALFPDRGFAAADIDAYNAQTALEMQQIRDFLILHYHANARAGEPFWDACRHMAIPDSLKQRIALFRSHGRVFREGLELFTEGAWLQVLHGQGVLPQDQHPLVDAHADTQIDAYLDNIRSTIARCVQAMPTHAAYLAETGARAAHP